MAKVSLKAIREQVKTAADAPIEADGTSKMYELFPRIKYSDLPKQLQAEADKKQDDIEELKSWLYNGYTIDDITHIADDLDNLIIEALHLSRYAIEGYREYTTSDGKPALDIVCSLYASDFLEAWELVTKDHNVKSVQGHRVKKLIYNNSKISNDFYYLSLPQRSDISGQMSIAQINPTEFNDNNSIPLKMEKTAPAKNAKPITLFYNYQYDMDFLAKMGLKISKDNYFDLWVQNAISNLYLAGNREVTLRQIFNAMPGKGTGETANSRQLQKILDSLIVQSSITLYVNTKELSEHWQQVTYKEIISHLLPITIVNERLSVNGRLANTYITIDKEPPLMKLARDLKHIRTLPETLLDVELTRNNTDYGIYDYLIRSIEYMRGSERSNKILFNTLMNDLNLTAKQRRGCKDTVLSLLQQFKDKQYIADYKRVDKGAKDGVVITLIKK